MLNGHCGFHCVGDVVVSSVVLLEDFDFLMEENQLKQITQLHNDGFSLGQISSRVKRNEYEVLLALIHQAARNKIERPLRR